MASYRKSSFRQGAIPLGVFAVGEACSCVRYYERTSSLQGWEQHLETWDPPILLEFVTARPLWHPLLQVQGLKKFLAGEPKAGDSSGLAGMASLSLPLQRLLLRMRAECPSFCEMDGCPLQSLLRCEAPPPCKVEAKQERPVDTLGSLSVETCCDFEADLLRPWPKQTALAHQQLHWGTILHGLVECAKNYCGQTWPESVILLSASAAQTAELVSLQANAELVLAVLGNNHHWALLALKKGCPKCLLLDALKDPEISLAADAFLVYMASHWLQRLELWQLDLPAQETDWECGQRVIVTADAILASVFEHREPWPPALLPDLVGAEAVRQLCGMGKGQDTVPDIPDLFDSPPKKAALKREPTFEAPSTPPRATRRKLPEGSPVHAKPLAGKRLKEEKKEIKAEGREAEDSDEMLGLLDLAKHTAQALVEEAATSKPRQKKATKKELKTKALKQLQEKGLSFTEFQNQHNELKKDCAKGHYEQFLLALARRENMTCKACQAFHARMMPAQPPKPLPAAPADPAAGEPGQQIALAEPEPEQSKRKRGRPKKGEEVQTMADWVAANRAPGAYVCQSATVFWCSRCKENVNVHRATACGSIWLERHEMRKHSDGGRPNEAAQCPGIVVGAGHHAIDKAPQAVRKWVEGGMLLLREDGNSKEYSFTWVGENLLLRASGCSDVLGAGACRSCTQAAGDKDFLDMVVRMSFRQELGNYAVALALKTDEEKQRLWTSLEEVDWKTWKSVLHDLAELRAIESSLGRLNTIKRKLGSVTRERRSSRYNAWLEATVLNLEMGSESDDARKMYAVLCKSFADKVVEGNIQRSDLKLAAEISCGSLRGDRVVTLLLKSFYDMRERMERGLQRTCSSKHLCEATCQEIFWTLGQGSGTQRVLKRFGVNLKEGGKVDLRSQWLPLPYVAHRCKDILKTNVFRALQLMEVPASRSFFVAMDESAWRKTYSCVAGLLEDTKCTVVGGCFRRPGGEDMSLLHSTEHLPDEHLSALSLHFLLCRMDSMDRVYDVSTIPMPKADGKKGKDILLFAGELLQAVLAANNDLAPSGFAFDCGAGNTSLKRVLLGLEKAVDCPVLCDLKQEASDVHPSLFPFKKVTYKGQVILPSLDSLHIQKRYSAGHVSGLRAVKWGSFFVDFSPALRRGLPWKSYCMREPMSDIEAVQRLNPVYAGNDDWSASGLGVATLVSALISSVGEGSAGSSCSERFSNAAMGYFLVLINTASAQRLYASAWQEHFLHGTTVRNVAHYMAGAMLACLTDLVPDGSIFAEKVCEHHFSKVKQPWRGTPSLRECIYSTQSVHVENSRKVLPKMSDQTKPKMPGLDPSEASRLFLEAYNSAALFQSWIQHDQRPQDVKENFELWWHKTGSAFLTQTQQFVDGQACEADDDEDDEAVQQEELQEFVDEETEAEGEYLQIVQTIEDLASEKQRLESMLCEGETAVETVEEASSAIIPAEAPSNVSTADGEACEATQITQRSEPPARTWTSLVQMCSQSQECWRPRTTSASAAA